MITKHRNRGLAQFACAIVMTIVLCVVFAKSGLNRSDGFVLLLVLLYFATITMWMVASFSLAKAKGYGSDMMGGLFIFLFILGFCFPIAPLVFPAFVVFGLKDKTRERLRRF